MKVITKPLTEEQVLAPVSEDATAEEIYKGFVAKAECCVNHLCGCSCDHGGCKSQMILKQRGEPHRFSAYQI